MDMIINISTQGLGYNLKSTDMQAALGYSQIDKLEVLLKKEKRTLNTI